MEIKIIVDFSEEVEISENKFQTFRDSITLTLEDFSAEEMSSIASMVSSKNINVKIQERINKFIERITAPTPQKKEPTKEQLQASVAFLSEEISNLSSQKSTAELKIASM